MLGAIIGDIVGSPYELEVNNIKTVDFPLFSSNSHFTDDTVMTVAVAEGLINGYSDYEKTKLIVGSVKELGTKYIGAVTAEGRMTVVGNNLFASSDTVQFCSYNGEQKKNLLSENIITIDPVALSTYKK